jgi:hypothetical protein
LANKKTPPLAKQNGGAGTEKRPIARRQINRNELAIHKSISPMIISSSANVSSRSSKNIPDFRPALARHRFSQVTPARRALGLPDPRR